MDYKDLTIYIPSRGRWMQQVTLRHFPPALLKRVKLVVPDAELPHYRRLLPQLQVNQFLCPRLNGIHKARQFAVESCKTKFLMFFDDDMDFCVRPDMDSSKLEMLEDVTPIVDTMLDWLRDGWKHVGLSARQGNNHQSEPYVDVIRMNNVYGYHVGTIRKHDIFFDTLEVMEDFYVTLRMLYAGYPNRVSFKYAWNQRGSGAKGGCSTYRTAEMQRRCAYELKDYFPDDVTVKIKTAKSTWRGMQERHDVVIQWKRAWKRIQQEMAQ